MNATSANYNYYWALRGHWRGRLKFEITDLQRLWTSHLRLTERLSVIGMSWLSFWPVQLCMTTTLELAGAGEDEQVLHSTRISSLGFTMYRSRESIKLSDDGRTFQLSGTQAFFPCLWRRTDWSATGDIAADHQSAVYDFSFFGEPLRQSTRVTAKGLELMQVTAFSRAVVTLRRQPAPPQP